MSLDAIGQLRGLPAGWQPIETIVRSGARSVHRIYNENHSRNEILKLVDTDAESDEKRALGEEFLLLEQLHHPHWVRPLGFVHLDDGSVGYRMEELEGPSPSGPEDEGWAPRDLSAVRAILGALGTLHAIGYAHLDLKPEQILRGRSGACLIDPGLAAPVGMELQARGTWGFIAPEVLAGGEPWDHRADLYSFGSLLYLVWTGEKLLGEGAIAEQIQRQTRRPELRIRERMPEMPEGLDRVVEALLDPDPSRRPKSAAAAWDALHTMAGYRDHYLEQEHLPRPDDLPFLERGELEIEWDEALRGNGPERWVIDGPIGSGRHRLLKRFQARAGVLGADTVLGDELVVEIRRPRERQVRRIVCRIGRPAPGERVVERGSVGEKLAQAALAAYGLEPEGGEQNWTHLLLRLRLEDRLGGEETRRASIRRRRSIAAAVGSEIEPRDRMKMAEALAALTDGEPPHGEVDCRPVEEGWARIEDHGRLRPAVPPWDTDALLALVGEDAWSAAHARMLLAVPLSTPDVAAQHAVHSRDRQRSAQLVLPGVERLRSSGSIGKALDLLEAAEALLGLETPAEWLVVHARLALLDGDPGRSLALLDGPHPPIDSDWGDLLQAHLAVRADRRKDALAIATRLQDATTDATIRRLAQTLTTKILAMLGRHDESIDVGRRVLAEMGKEVPTSDRLEVVTVLLDALSESGQIGPDLDQVRASCEQLLTEAGARERCLTSSALGGAAFRRGEFSEAKRFLEASVRAAEEWGDRLRTAIAETNVAGIYFEEGRLAECEAMNRRAIDLFDSVGDRTLSAGTRLNIVSVLCVAGRWGEALTVVRRAREELESIEALDDVDAAILLEETLLVETGLLESASRIAEELRGRLQLRPQPILECILERDLGRVARWKGSSGRAMEHWGRARSIAHDAGAADEEARTLLEQSCAATTAGALDEAVTYLDAAERTIGETESRELRVRYLFARAMLESHQDSAKALRAAMERLDRALHAAIESEMRGWIWRCHGARAGIAKRLESERNTLSAIRLGEEGLRELLEAIGAETLQDAYLALPEPRRFLSWLENDLSALSRFPTGSSDLEVFLR